jgi:hypothetical protein
MSESPSTSTPAGHHEQGLTWATYIGGVSGLVFGVLLAHAGSLGAFFLWPESEAARVVWEVTAPLLALLGVLAGAWVFHRFLREQWLLATVVFVGLVGVGIASMFVWFGFPWLV